jgi:hypothetical protein
MSTTGEQGPGYNVNETGVSEASDIPSVPDMPIDPAGTVSNDDRDDEG